MLGVTGRESARRHRVIPSPRSTTHAYLRITTSSCLHLGRKVPRRSPSSTGGIHTMSTSLPSKHIMSAPLWRSPLKGVRANLCRCSPAQPPALTLR